MRNENNLSLFWYGFWANVKKTLGGFLLVFGFAIGGLGLLTQEGGFIVVGLVMFIAGSYFLVKGYSQRFDYKRQSGYIVHQGDRY